jgi:hypothetical protein
VTTAARKTARRRALAAESVVYDGSKLIGEIKPKAGMFTARLASGRRLGAFTTDQLAMKAITAAARAARTENSGTQR